MTPELGTRSLYRGIEGKSERSTLKAYGFTDEEIDLPLVAVVNSWTNIVPGHVHLDRIADAVEVGIWSGPFQLMLSSLHLVMTPLQGEVTLKRGKTPFLLWGLRLGCD